MERRFRSTLLLSALLIAVELWAQSLDIVVERNVAMKTRDGVTLHADIYHPAGNAKYPVLLERTPYDKNNAAAFAESAAKRGYVVVVQDVRGRYTSEGEWYTFKHEGEDGFDAVEWAAALPNSNGKVGMFGGSYVGATQMLAAVNHPPHLAGICPVVTASNYHENWTYQGGAFEQWFNQSWTTGLAQDTLNRKVKAASNARVGNMVLPLKQYPLFNLKISDADQTPELAPYYLDWLRHPEYDDYWKQWAIEEQYASIQVPALTVAAWYDIFQGGSLRNYKGLEEHAGNQAARDGQRLLITIGGHAGMGRKIGDVDFGPEAAQFDENQVTLAWYDFLFKGIQNEFATGKRVKIFVMGENKWRLEDDWPLQRAQATRYFLHSSGKANGATGDGTLSTVNARTEPGDGYVYDPMNPTPTVGGPLCCDGEHLAPGPKDQREVESRPDVLVYSTPALTQDTEVTGPITLDLYAKSSAVDTDFTAKLVDVGPDGFAQNLTEGILRARYRESTTSAKPIVPGEIYEYKIDLWSTSNVFLKGHKIRLEVSSSNFPRFDRNLNTGKSGNDSEEGLKANNTIYHDASHPSALVLPVTPR
ncbi:hydrolase, CocE/NonD family [Acidisarcina polymorpha]|uniref:Hydrolase, CocE/NonD family n=1 Tax=Acidisarcina polymorpha TaxID=2211140 RepID=A0A2Z5G5Z2_9BACT|nr:CocE/NonD family hydrolase [Acidisarcina polymorpha]AXC14632.1 hydrolase, CocE/NonD family [Acidisarcina polymorpha]